MTFKTSSKRTAEIEAASKNEENLLSGIAHPGLHDCLGGRGGHATNHPGNIQFRVLVNQYKDHYMGLSRYGKLQVAAEVVKIWRSQAPAGRFLAMTNPSHRENTTWHDIGDKEAIKKTSQCLRERIPANQKARTMPTGSTSKDAKAMVEKTKRTTAKLHQLAESNGADDGSNNMDHTMSNMTPLTTSSLNNNINNNLNVNNHARENVTSLPAAVEEQGSHFSQWLMQQANTSQQEPAAITPSDYHTASSNKMMRNSFVNNSNNNNGVPSLPLHIDGSDHSRTNQNNRQQQQPQRNHRQYSSISSDLGDWMYEMRHQTQDSSSQQQQQQQQRQEPNQTFLIPSAANLTLSAFDSNDGDLFKPHNVFTRKPSITPSGSSEEEQDCHSDRTFGKPNATFSRKDSNTSNCSDFSGFMANQNNHLKGDPLDRLLSDNFPNTSLNRSLSDNLGPVGGGQLQRSISSGLSDLFSW